MKYCDLHCDLLDKIRTPAAWTDEGDLQITPASLCGGVFLQVFAVFAENTRADMAYFRAKASLFQKIKARAAACGVRAVLSVENGSMAEERAENVGEMLAAGVKLFGLVWNGGNALGGAHDTGGGLTAWGKTVVEFLAAEGALPDVSHLSDAGFAEVAAIMKACRKPFVASHSCARALCPHSRNLTDGQLRALADAGGLAGVNFYPPFLGGFSPAQHIAYMIDVCGEDAVALGSDFDGMAGGYYKNCADAAQRIEGDLERAGLSSRQIEKVLQQNVLRLLGD